MRITGAVVYTISETKFSARFSKTYTGSTIQCHLEDIEQIATLNKDETLTLVGTPLGSLTSTGVIFEPCRIERKTANQNVKPITPVKSPVKNPGNVVGSGITRRLSTPTARNRNYPTAKVICGSKKTVLTKTVSGQPDKLEPTPRAAIELTLNRENVGAKTYTMTIAGTTVTLKSGTGGYKLVHE